MPSSTSVNANLKLLLIERGISQRELAFGIKYSETDVSLAVRHSRASPELKQEIADYLNVNMEDIFRTT